MKNYILKISLDNTDLWRKVALPHGYTFTQLHEVIQLILGWDNCHLHEWKAAGLLIVADEGDDDDIIEEEFEYESDVSLDLILMNEKSITYSYDFGDGWELTIDIEKNDADGAEYPQLLEYGGTMAIEDCGGVEGLKEQGGKPVNAKELNLILQSTFEGSEQKGLDLKESNGSVVCSNCEKQFEVDMLKLQSEIKKYRQSNLPIFFI